MCQVPFTRTFVELDIEISLQLVGTGEKSQKVVSSPFSEQEVNGDEVVTYATVSTQRCPAGRPPPGLSTHCFFQETITGRAKTCAQRFADSFPAGQGNGSEEGGLTVTVENLLPFPNLL